MISDGLDNSETTMGMEMGEGGRSAGDHNKEESESEKVELRLVGWSKAWSP